MNIRMLKAIFITPSCHIWQVNVVFGTPSTFICFSFARITMVKVSMVAVMVILAILITTPMHVSDGTPTDWNGLPHLSDDIHNPILHTHCKV